MEPIRDLWNALDSTVITIISVALILVAAVIVERIFVRVLRRAYWRRVERAAAARGVAELSRVKRQKTLVTLLESLLRYGVYGAALVIVIGLLSGGKANAFFGASIVAVLVGFGLQRLLGDVVAGALLLFEGHFAVGDVITVHPQNLTGTVEEFSLRTTSLRTLGGDRVTMMNGGILSFTRWSYGQREFRVECLVRPASDDVVERLGKVCAWESSAATSLWVRPPAVATKEQPDEEHVRVLVSAVVAPSHEVLVERLAAMIEATAGDALVGPVTIVPLYAPTFDAWRSGLLLRE